MTRMWGVDAEMLCDEHLLGEHKEMHQIAGSIESHPHGEAIARGRADKDQIDTSLIQERHDALADELRLRGMSHDSPMDYDDDLDLGEIDIAANRRELRERCDDWATRRTVAETADDARERGMPRQRRRGDGGGRA